ncbi:GNAT family N-acetyltransferase [Novosphingobium album (ex Liu et al. 2023)]|uniref:GNAT family N-acetyltransferase n=1 Tax=Novosphingobium album (ex Liu et al. 2023) TaxID=3031130 RepID=A0ABT5WQR7_9SPHN|nr:GNAT family N-acetyltransferase [Novosphingobium album (ex Liu et al. 2023)]MDE8651627.1 GNAT family N-acetyltransferase [Novosphingobium album (ex Liu et al. 2023)]
MTEQPVLTTERFELWRPRASDLDGLVQLIADEETRRFLGPARADAPSQWDRLLRNAGSWSLYGYGTFMVRRPGEDAIVASCGVFHSWRGLGHGMDDQPEAGWIVHRDGRGQAIAGEVMRAAIAWFERTHGPRRIVCMIEEGNHASEKVATRLGFARYHTQAAEEDGAVLNFYERLPR